MRCCAASLGLGLACLAHAGPAMAPDFALKALDGRNYRLSEYRGEVVAVVFWASWCGGCREQVALLQRLEDVYREWGLRVLAINLDEKAGTAASVAAAMQVRFPVLQDPDRSVSRAWDPARLPATYLVDRSGALRHAVLAGEAPPETKELIDRVRALLDE